jgi:hypothetical protein
MDTERIEQIIKKETGRYYWLGAIAGMIMGVIFGIGIGYKLGSDHVIVVPLEQGQEI